MQYTAYRTKLKLNNSQATLYRKHAGFSRWVYNWGLRLWSEGYKEGLKPSANTLKKLFTNHVKPLFPWMSQLSSKVYQYAFISLGEAFKRFFKKLGGYPRFKKKGLHDSFTIDNSGTPIKIGGVRHKLPFIGWVRTHEAMPECATKKVTISLQAGEWYLSFHVEVPELEPTPHQRETIGVDLGINALATCSDGTVFANSKAYRKAKKRLGRLQQELNRKVKGSANWHKAVLKVVKLHRTVANIRKEAIHKITTFLAKNHTQVVIEDLNVAGMLKNHSLAGSIADASFGEFRRQLEYKTQRYGSFLVIADRFFPSSQLCSECRHQQKMLLGSRTFECEKCGSVKDRDFNASVNLEHYPTAVGLTVDACGAGAADSPC